MTVCPMACQALPEVACMPAMLWQVFCIASTPLAVRDGLQGILDHPAICAACQMTPVALPNWCWQRR